MNPWLRVFYFSLAILISETQVVDAFEIDGNIDYGLQIGAIFDADESPISVGFVGPGRPETLDAEQAENDLISILETWNAVSCSSITLVLSTSGQPDIPIYWGDNRSNTCIPAETDIGFTYFSPCIDGDFTYVRNSILLNSNPRYDWQHDAAPYQNSKTDRVVDFQGVLTHEIGHALGLQHSDTPLSTMFSKYLIDGGMRSLSADDKLKLCAIYPNPKNECTVDDHCGEGTCLSKDGFSVCEERRGESGDYCALDNLTCKTCLVTSSATYTGYCTQSCNESSACPTGMECADDDFCRLESEGVVRESCSTTRNFSTFSLFIFAFILAFRRKR